MKTMNINQYYIDILPKDIHNILEQEYSTFKKLKKISHKALMQNQKQLVHNILQGAPGTEYFNIVRLIALP